MAGRGGDPKKGLRQVSILRLLGLFDHPASSECLKALRQAPAIARLTVQLVGLDDETWNIAVTSLEELDLVSNQNGTLDAHPLVREYFAKQLREKQKKAWTEGHRRLYEHLCETTEHQPDTIEGLQPLYQAVAHGCQAGLYQQACVDVYIGRILRGMGNDGFYSTKKLGAIGADLGAVACFFDPPWRRLSPNLSADYQSWLLNEAAYRLRALGRVVEASEPMRASVELYVEQESWESTAAVTASLCDLELTLGEVSLAIQYAGQAMIFADRSKDRFQQLVARTTLADALHQAGQRDEARRLFADAETMQLQDQPEYPLLYSVQGFQYCDLLLSDVEQTVLNPEWKTHSLEHMRSTCVQVTLRVNKTITWARLGGATLLSVALDNLTLGRAGLYLWVLNGSWRRAGADAHETRPMPPSNVGDHLTDAVDGLREAGSTNHLPGALISRAWLRFLIGNIDASEADLSEAQEIATRGAMKLIQCLQWVS